MASFPQRVPSKAGARASREPQCESQTTFKKKTSRSSQQKLRRYHGLAPLAAIPVARLGVLVGRRLLSQAAEAAGGQALKKQ